MIQTNSVWTDPAHTDMIQREIGSGQEGPRQTASGQTRLRETWLSKNHSTKKFQAPFRQVGVGFSLNLRISIYLLCKS
jgi:hypothetical protein